VSLRERQEVQEVPREGGVETPPTPAPIRHDPNPGALRSALHFGYDVAWVVAAIAGLPWLAWRSLRDRAFFRMVKERTCLGVPRLTGSAPRILVHGVSVGEVKVAVPLVRELAQRHPNYEVVVSSTTNSGIEVARKVLDGVRVVRFPADLSPLVRLFLRRIRPACVILIELEIWPNFLREANRSGIPVAVVNGRITESSYAQYLLFKRTLPQFNRISLFCVQGGAYADRFRALHVDQRRVILTGNIKADGLKIGPVDPGEELRRLLGGRPGQTVLVAGSTHHPEERWVVEAWRKGTPGARLILVPRHPDRCREVARALAAEGSPAQLLTDLRAGLEAPDPDRPVLVDTIGELERIYGLADVVFVGGTLVDHGGQNMLEPAAQGRSVVFGPSVANFAQEAALLIESGACRQVSDRHGLPDALAELARGGELRERMSRAGLEAVATQRGAAEATVRALSERCLAGSED
jgi:3-deoxy-D-manno-octulosonic-acid transferase